ncbi:MAG: HlyD family efflux transporter periplasmic adaptor subunit, partial [Holosporaceae bacterium]|nr:HlyD family efflux transporter periplasmic adaptor subunit [Holosporaceae bacterium]
MNFKKCLFLTLLFCAACDNGKEHEFPGYVEGEYVYIASGSSGVLERIDVVRGQEVKVGHTLFAVDFISLESSLNLAQSEYDDLLKGKRPEEIQIVKKQMEQAQVNLINAKRCYERHKGLVGIGAVSQAELDEKTADYQACQAKVQELSAALDVANMGARKDALNVAKQKIIQAKKKLEDASPKTKQSGRIEEIYYHLGEFVEAGSPVISFLPFENVKIRFFIPQKILSKINFNQEIKITFSGNNVP